MLTYHAHIYNLAMAASAEAIRLASSFSNYSLRRSLPDYDKSIDEELPHFQREASSLGDVVDRLLSSLPSEVRESVGRRTNLSRHVGFIHYWLDQRSPMSCSHDPIDIVEIDLPKVLELFDRWYERQSNADVGFQERLAPIIEAGQLNSAVREAYAIFKTRMVESFGLSAELDGHPLADALFGSDGATANLLDKTTRQGYLHLLKGLYTLYRNPVAHNDMRSNPGEVDAVLVLVNSALVNIERARRVSGVAPEGTT